MTSRIQEIAKQAGCKPRVMASGSIRYMGAEGNLEKFAELLIDEWTEMTKKELKKLMQEYIARQNTVKDEWWVTQQELAKEVLVDFAGELDIDLDSE